MIQVALSGIVVFVGVFYFYFNTPKMEVYCDGDKNIEYFTTKSIYGTVTSMQVRYRQDGFLSNCKEMNNELQEF